MPGHCGRWVGGVLTVLLRVASLEDTLRGKMKVWSDTSLRQSKKLKDLADIARMVESHPRLWDILTSTLKQLIHQTETK